MCVSGFGGGGTFLNVVRYSITSLSSLLVKMRPIGGIPETGSVCFEISDLFRRFCCCPIFNVTVSSVSSVSVPLKLSPLFSSIAVEPKVRGIAAQCETLGYIEESLHSV